MKRTQWWTRLTLLPVLALLLAVVAGCPGSGDTGSSSGATKKDGAKAEGGSGESKKGGAEVASTGWGTLKGVVSLEGMPPNMEQEDKQVKDLMNKHKDKSECEKGSDSEKTQQSWRIKNGKVENVVVFLKPVKKGDYFKVDPTKKTWKDEVVIDQPHCAYLPHVTLLFPYYISGKDASGKDVTKPTGQKFLVKNSASFVHNTKYAQGDSPDATEGKNTAINSKDALEVTGVKALYSQPIKLECTIHTWMNGYAWALDHPYAAVTDSDGAYEIKNVPAGADLQIVVWHEGKFVNKGETTKLKDGENVKDFAIKAQ